MFKNILLVAALVAFAAPAFAADTGYCEEWTTCLAPSAGATGDGTAATDARPSAVVETNSTAITIPFVVTVTGTSDDTGTEVCALVGMDCLDSVVFDEAGAAGDEFTAGTCATDVADAARAIHYCY